MSDNPYRRLPAVGDVLEAAPLHALAGAHAHEHVVAAVRAELDDLRRRLSAGEGIDGDLSAEAVAARAAVRLAEGAKPKLRAVINATGVVLHTNLGRAP